MIQAVPTRPLRFLQNSYIVGAQSAGVPDARDAAARLATASRRTAVPPGWLPHIARNGRGPRGGHRFLGVSTVVAHRAHRPGSAAAVEAGVA